MPLRCLPCRWYRRTATAAGCDQPLDAGSEGRVIRPLRLRATNLGPFASLDLDLPSGCVAVLGRVSGASVSSNGAGKSTLVNAIECALFAGVSLKDPSRAPQPGRELAELLTDPGDETELMIELEFDHRGETYRVRRGYSARGGGKATMDLERQFDGDPEGQPVLVWEPITRETAKDTQALLDSILSFTRRTLRASSFLRQRDASAFTLADRADRMEILAEVALGRDPVWPKVLRVASERRKTVQAGIVRIDGRLEGVTADGLRQDREELAFAVRASEGAIDRSSTELAESEAALADAEQALRAAEAQVGERRVAETRRDAAVAAYEARARLREDALVAASAAAAIKETLDGLPDVTRLGELAEREQALVLAVEQHRGAVRAREEAVRLAELRTAEYDAMVAQAAAAQRKARELDEKVAHLKSGTLDTCPTCQQELGSVARADTISSLRAQAEQHEEEAQALMERVGALKVVVVPADPVLDPQTAESLSAVRQEIRVTREAEVQRATLLERLNSHSRTIMEAASPEYLADLERLDGERQAAEDAFAACPRTDLGQIANLQRTIGDNRMRRELHRSTLDTLRTDHAVQTERLAQLDKRIETFNADLAERDLLHTRVDRLAVIERACNRDGIPAQIVANIVIPHVEHEAGRLLNLLGGPVSHVELRQEAATKAGGLKAALDIVCLLDDGERRYERLSGGEQFRVDLALRLALAQRIAADVSLLVIDEPDGLDSAGKQALIEIMQTIESRGQDVYLVSHDSELRDSFATVIEVVNENGRARVVGADVEAAVA